MKGGYVKFWNKITLWDLTEFFFSLDFSISNLADAKILVYENDIFETEKIEYFLQCDTRTPMRAEVWKLYGQFWAR